MFPAESKILIVDDSHFSRNILKGGLKDLNFWKIMEADSAKTAKNLLMEDEQVQQPVHLMICDVHMPEVTGIDLLRWVRNQDRIKNMPVIILTTAQEKKAILEAGKLGVSHYMIKPFDLNTLRNRLTSAWEKHGQKWFGDSAKT